MGIVVAQVVTCTGVLPASSAQVHGQTSSTELSKEIAPDRVPLGCLLPPLAIVSRPSPFPPLQGNSLIRPFYKVES